MIFTTNNENLKGELVRITTRDGLELHGFLFEPKKKTKNALVHVHAWIGNFYENKFLDYIANEATSRNFAFFTFNNRGAGIVTDFIKRKKSRFDYKRIGGSLEKFEDCVFDIKAAIDFLVKRGYKNIILEGHSLGCNKVVFYKYKMQDKKIGGLILLGPVDDVNCAKRLLGKKYEKSLEIARGMDKKNKSDNFLPRWMEFYPLMTAERFLNIADPGTLSGRIFYYGGELKEIKNMGCPTLAIFGSKDDYEYEPGKALKVIRNKIKNCDTALVKNADHWFNNQEKKLSKLIGNWLKLNKNL